MWLGVSASWRRLRRRPAFRVIRSMFWGLIVAALLVWLVEVGLRLRGSAVVYDPEQIAAWRLEPGLTKERPGARGGVKGEVRTNDDGLRSSLSRARPPGVRRLVLLGDSLVFGWGVDEGETLSDGLTSALGPGFEVLNAGIPGYSTTQAAWLYGEVVQHYAPDAVILFLSLHDYSLVPVSDAEALDGGDGPAAAIQVALAKYSRFYALLHQWISPGARANFLTEVEAAPDRIPRVPRVSDAERTAAVQALRRTIHEAGGQLSLGLLPGAAELNGVIPPMPRGATWLGQIQQQLPELGLVDVRACCRGPTLVLPDDPGHLSAEGNRVVGAAIAEVWRQTSGAADAP